MTDQQTADNRWRRIRTLVNEQAEDERLWGASYPDGRPLNIIEATLQQELRRLHEMIEAGPNNRLVGMHWLEVAFERAMAGESEESVMRDYGWRR